MFLFYRREEFMHWVEMLPDTQTPSWLGLPSNAEKVLLTTQGAVIRPLCLSCFCLFVFPLLMILLFRVLSLTDCQHPPDLEQTTFYIGLVSMVCPELNVQSHSCVISSSSYWLTHTICKLYGSSLEMSDHYTHVLLNSLVHI